MSEKGKNIKEKKKPNFIEAVSMIVVLLALVIYSVKFDISIIPAMFWVNHKFCGNDNPIA